LPIINVLIGHYLPSLLRLGGDLTTAGLVVKSLIGGFLFWFIQKVLVPLMVV
jgi:cytosine/uracil/thiamine/allantoin permease